MRLRIKFALYNALIKALIIAVLAFLLPGIVQNLVYNHIDKQLTARAESILIKIKAGYMTEIQEQDCRFDDYNILKEQFISINSIDSLADTSTAYIFKNENWTVGGEPMFHRVIHKKFIYDNQHYELNIGEGLSTIEQLDKTFVKAIVWLMAIIIAVTFLLDLGFVQILLGPFNKIVDKLKSIEDPLRYKPHPVKSFTREFKYLDHTFDELMVRIKTQFNNEKDFIANVSHELQTPISILQNRFENIITEGKADDETTAKIIESQKTLRRLSKVIKALLLISKIENEQYLKNEKVNISELCNEVTEELQERCEYKNITLNCNISSDFEMSNANRTLLYNMLFNIGNNAIKYNKPDGSVILSSEKTGGNFQLIIKDSGVGISEENLPKIFERFKRFHENDGSSFGLGLPIVKTIADFHHIKIDVSSKLNEGTTFTLTFPESENAAH